VCPFCSKLAVWNRSATAFIEMMMRSSGGARWAPSWFAHGFCCLTLVLSLMVWYGMVNVDLYSAIITKVSNALDTHVHLLSSFIQSRAQRENDSQSQKSDGTKCTWFPPSSMLEGTRPTGPVIGWLCLFQEYVTLKKGIVQRRAG